MQDNKPTANCKPSRSEIHELLDELSFAAMCESLVNNPPPSTAVCDHTRVSRSELAEIKAYAQPRLHQFHRLLTAIHRGELKATYHEIKNLKFGLRRLQRAVQSFEDDYKRTTAGSSDRANSTLAEDRTLARLGGELPPGSHGSPPEFKNRGSGRWTQVPDRNYQTEN